MSGEDVGDTGQSNRGKWVGELRGYWEAHYRRNKTALKLGSKALEDVCLILLFKRSSRLIFQLANIVKIVFSMTECRITVACCVNDPVVISLASADNVSNCDTNEHSPNSNLLALTTMGWQKVSWLSDTRKLLSKVCIGCGPSNNYATPRSSSTPKRVRSLCS